MRLIVILSPILLVVAALPNSTSANQQEPSAAHVIISSGPSRVSLVELYSSEGCSSCPPADAWLSTLSRSPLLWKKFVPVAFHVTYWDSLGWHDPFAAPANTVRQRAYAAQWINGSVYTPCFVVDGKEWQAWFHDRRNLPVSTDRPGLLKAVVDHGHVRVTYQPAKDADPPPDLSVTVALLGFGLTSSVEAGENRGRCLTHDFLVLARTDVTMKKDSNVFTAHCQIPVKPTPRSGIRFRAERHALALWVSSEGHIKPIQAAGGWIPESSLED